MATAALSRGGMSAAQWLPTKVPYTPGLGAKARSNDPMTWRSYAEAQATLEKGAVDGISYALTPRRTCRARSRRLHGRRQHPVALGLELVETAQSYTEITPSKLGLRIIGAVIEPLADMHFKLSRGDNGAAVEVYHQATRFITLSRVPFGPEVPLADIGHVLAALDRGARRPRRHGRQADPPTRSRWLPCRTRSAI